MHDRVWLDTFGVYLEIRYCRAFYSHSNVLNFHWVVNFKAKGVWLQEIFTQRVKYSDLCVRKNPNGKGNDMLVGRSAGVR